MTESYHTPNRPLGRTGLSCHPVGFGCYRINRGNAAHEAALRLYLDRGGNLIDTSANYGDGLSEALVGLVLRDYARDKAVVVTKGGYIQGQNMELARRVRFPEVVLYGDGIWHCIHPEFLETQVQRSLERMKLEFVDVYLLHNPEYFLSDRGHHGPVSEQDHEEFYRRVREAFLYLERQVDAGRIRWYGISSNNFGLPAADPLMTSVSRCLEAARSVRADHHFRVVQLPMNLFEAGGAVDQNNDGKTVLELCGSEGIGVLANRPLNAFAGNRLVRLADFVKPGEPTPGPDELGRILEPLRRLEARLATELQVPLMLGGPRGLSDHLLELVPQIRTPDRWEAVAGTSVLRPLQQWMQSCGRKYSADWRWQAWTEELAGLLSPLFEDIGRHLSSGKQAASDDVRRRLSRAGYPATSESLSRMALNVLLNSPGLDCVLTGMRRTGYVEDAMGAAGLPPVDGLAILRNFDRS